MWATLNILIYFFFHNCNSIISIHLLLLKHPSEIAKTKLPCLIRADGGRHVFVGRDGLEGGTKFAYPQCFSPCQIYKDVFHQFLRYFFLKNVA